MRRFATAIIVTLLVSSGALAQTSPPPPSTPPAAQAAPSTTAPPPQEGKREACARDVQAKALRGQAKRDQMQLCVAQGHLDCVKQAIDQRTVGAQRKDFIKACMGAKGAGRSPI